MEKGVEKKKEKEFPLIWAGGMNFGPPRARARALRRFRPSGGPRAGERRGGDGVAQGPLASERGGGREGTALRLTGGGEPAVRGGGPAAGELGGGSPPVARF